MLYYRPQAHLNLMDYGILVPLKDERASLSLKKLACEHNFQKALRIGFLKPDDLKQVFEASFIDRLWGKELEQEIIKTFELINANGEFHRYDPLLKKKDFSQLRDSILLQCEGTLESCQLALKNQSFVYHFGGGLHHGHYDHGSGFCLLNDLVLAVVLLKKQGLLKSAWVLDIDAHKGDGTAAMLRDKKWVKTLSIHMKEGWPLDSDRLDEFGKLKPCFVPSDLDIEIQKGEEIHYLPRLQEGLEKMQQQYGLPDLCLIVGGEDPWQGDGLPGSALLQLTSEQMLQRDLMVYDFFKKNAVPQVWTLGGGYGELSWTMYYQFLAELRDSQREKI